MSIRGHVQNGAIILDDPVELPDGASVRIEFIDADKSQSLHPDVLRFTGILPRDLDAREKYVEGMRKKHQ